MISLHIKHRIGADAVPYEAVLVWVIDDEDDLLGISEQLIARQMGWEYEFY